MTNDAENLFSFETASGVYTFEKPFADLLTPRFLRLNRRRNETDLLFTIIEELASPEALDAIDDMSAEEFADFAAAMQKAMQAETGATLGE